MSEPTAEAALHAFFSGFGIPAYAATATPSNAKFPYLTYELVLGAWGDGEVNIPVNVWYRTNSEAQPNAKVREIGSALSCGGVQLACEGGAVWLRKGSPWAQAVRVEGEDEKVKRRYVNVNAVFNTSREA